MPLLPGWLPPALQPWALSTCPCCPFAWSQCWVMEESQLCLPRGLLVSQRAGLTSLVGRVLCRGAGVVGPQPWAPPLPHWPVPLCCPVRAVALCASRERKMGTSKDSRKSRYASTV